MTDPDICTGKRWLHRIRYAAVVEVGEEMMMMMMTIIIILIIIIILLLVTH